MRRSRKSFQEITFFVGVGDGGGGYMYIWYIYKHMLYICIYYKQNSYFYLIFTDVKRNLLLIKRRRSLTPREHCMRTTTVGGVDRQKWTAMEIKNLHIPTWSTPSDFVVFAAVRYTNVQGRSYGTPDYKVSSPMAINTTMFK